MIASNQLLYINQVLHKPFEKGSKNVLSYWCLYNVGQAPGVC